eukprot:TRINITY_DN125756_c0_g1_i1.p1 TRINITY_DN125756_c0_g1~~TRINITY_DN125756_c0_g1_i1.p1  ORF type:complete len:322 (-),score=72.57 TRINITY_DN125756_c0_g1_i1:43-1008(-)
MAARASTKLRTLLREQQGKTLLVPGCFNALSARVLEKAGFDCIYMTGYGTSLSLLGMPDAGYATMTEMQLNARYIANATTKPVIADADNGYGNAINVVRCIREYIQTGVAGAHLEDQVIPKRCGHVAGKSLVSLDEAVGKIKAAHDVRLQDDKDFFIIARTDARGAGLGLNTAIDRAGAYLEAGADMAFVEGPTNVDEVKEICKALPSGTVFYNQTGVSPKFGYHELNELGIAMCIIPNALTRCAIKSMYDLAVQLKEDPLNEKAFMEEFKGHPCGDMHAFAGFGEVRAQEERYLPEDELKAKYDGAAHGWRADDDKKAAI